MITSAITTTSSSASSPTHLLFSKVRQLGFAAFGRRANSTQHAPQTTIPKHSRSATFGEPDLSLRRTGSGSIFTVPHHHPPGPSSSFFSPQAPPPPPLFASSSSSPSLGSSPLRGLGTRPTLSLTPTPTPTPTLTPTPTPTTRTTPTPLSLPHRTASQTSLVSSSKGGQGKKAFLLANRLGVGGSRVKKHASQERRLDKAEQSKKAFIKQWLRTVSAANASSGRSDDDLDDGEGVEVVVDGDDEDVQLLGSEADVEVGDIDVEDVEVEVVDDSGDDVVEVVLDKPPIPPPLPLLPLATIPILPTSTIPTTTSTMPIPIPIPSTPTRNAYNFAYNNYTNTTSRRSNSNNRKMGTTGTGSGCVRYLNLRQSGYTPEEEKMFLVSSLVLRPSTGRERRRSSDTSPPADVIMIGSSDASGEEEESRMDDESEGPDIEDGEEEEIQVVETWPWSGPGVPATAPTTPTTGKNIKQRSSSHGSLGNRSNITTARRRALKRARLKNRIKILGGAPVAPPPASSSPLPSGGETLTRTTGGTPRRTLRRNRN